QTLAVNGPVTAETVLRTDGVIVAAEVREGRLLWLVHDGGRYVREDGQVVLGGPLDARLRFGLERERTLVARGGGLAVVGAGAVERLAVDICDGEPAFASGEAGRCWASGGQLLRQGALGPERIGDVLAGQTRLFIGPRHGFGFYRAGELSVAFLFTPARRGLDDGLALPPLRGQLLEAHCVFEGERTWFLTRTRHAGRLVHRCLQLGARGEVEAAAEQGADEAGWLGWPRGTCAVAGALLAPTDDGIVRVEAQGGRLEVTRRFPATEPFVSSSTRLLPAPDGLWAVEAQQLRLLKLV
ncbi:MAG: hypothetical protein ACK4N5_05790, partial [Myxococcales bacterium]